MGRTHGRHRIDEQNLAPWLLVKTKETYARREASDWDETQFTLS